MEALTLSELTLLIKETIDISFSEYFLVIAEISQININYSGHAYLQLVEKDENSDKILANIRAVIWANKYNLISVYFESVTGSGLNAGMKILIKAEISFHQVYGLSLVIHDIDPTYTLGDIEKQRQEIINKLKEDGIFEMNKELEFPLVPQRIAVISSPTAAGLGDFINHIDSNEYNFKFEHTLFKATMQGEKTEKSIIAALDKIYASNEKFDIVAIIRGGGSKLDLTAFDSYNIAANIAQFPLPILVGIGHQRDLSTADLVAYKSLKTPTATADFILQKTIDFQNQLDSKFDYIKNFATSYINEQILYLTERQSQFKSQITNILHSDKLNLKILKEQLKSETNLYLLKKEEFLKHSISKYRNSLSNMIKAKIQQNLNLKQNFNQKINNYLDKKETELKIIETKLDAHNPQHILNLGFSITYKDDKLVKSPEEIKKGDRIKTRLKNGEIDSEIL